MTTKQIKKELEYNKQRLLAIAMTFNPDCAFGPGLKSQVIKYRAEIERLNQLLDEGK